MNAKKLVIIPVLLVAFGAIAQEANLTMKPVAGKKYNVEVNTVTDVTQNMSGMEMKVQAVSSAAAVMQIEEVASNGNFTVLSTWKDVSITSSAMGKDTTVHAENLNVVMKTLYDKSGKIIKNEKISTDNGADLAMATIEQIAKNIKLPVLPAKNAKKGDTWSFATNDTVQTAENPFEMVVDASEEYSFAGVETKDGTEYYRVNVSGPTKVSGEGSQMGMDMHIEGTGTSEGYSLHNKTTLFPAFVESKVGLDMSIMVSGAQSMAIPMTQNTTTTTKFTEVK